VGSAGAISLGPIDRKAMLAGARWAVGGGAGWAMKPILSALKNENGWQERCRILSSPLLATARGGPGCLGFNSR